MLDLRVHSWFDWMVASYRMHRQMHKGIRGPQHISHDFIVKPFIDLRLQRSVAPQSYCNKDHQSSHTPILKLQASFEAPEVF